MLALTLWLTACGGDRASSDSIALDPSTDDETIVEGTELGSATQRWPRPLDTLDPDAPAQWGVDVLDRFPHDARAFTQGLEALGDGTLLESTGLRGESTIRVVDPTTDKLEQVWLITEAYGIKRESGDDVEAMDLAQEALIAQTVGGEAAAEATEEAPAEEASEE
ncbi:MAG: hypothetical protein EBY44_09755 [Actinobacteria bacterium]|nr:hypothetical protein [Actinomycetota bacterium]